MSKLNFLIFAIQFLSINQISGEFNETSDDITTDFMFDVKPTKPSKITDPPKPLGPPRVMLSYARLDLARLIRFFEQELTELGIEVWLVSFGSFYDSMKLIVSLFKYPFSYLLCSALDYVGCRSHHDR